MIEVANATLVWITVRWQCHCARWVLWEATPDGLERHGLDLFELAWGRATARAGAPPASACDVLESPNFTCLCGRRVPVIETIKALLQFSAPVLWYEAPTPGTFAAGALAIRPPGPSTAFRP